MWIGHRKEIRKPIHIINHAIITGNLAQIVKKATCLMTPTQYNSQLSLLNELCSKKEIIGWTHWHADQGWRKMYDPNFVEKPKSEHQERHNLESEPKCKADPRSTVFSKYANSRFLRPDPSIRKYSPPSCGFDELRFRDKLVWTVSLTGCWNKAAPFANSPGVMLTFLSRNVNSDNL